MFSRETTVGTADTTLCSYWSTALNMSSERPKRFWNVRLFVADVVLHLLGFHQAEISRTHICSPLCTSWVSVRPDWIWRSVWPLTSAGLVLRETLSVFCSLSRDELSGSCVQVFVSRLCVCVCVCVCVNSELCVLFCFFNWVFRSLWPARRVGLDPVYSLCELGQNVWRHTFWPAVKKIISTRRLVLDSLAVVVTSCRLSAGRQGHGSILVFDLLHIFAQTDFREKNGSCK